MNKRITGIIHSLSPGGAEKNFTTLFNHLSHKGYLCTIICFSAGNPNSNSLELSSKIKLIKLSEYSLLRLPFLLIELRKILISEDPDCIISFMDQTNILSLLACRGIKKIPVIACERNNPAYNLIMGRKFPKLLQSAAKILRNFIYSYADLICTQTEGAASYFHKHCPQIKTAIIPNFIEPFNEIRPMDQRPEVIICVARLVPEKGLTQLIQVFYSLNSASKNWRLEIYGEGPEREALNTLISKLEACNEIQLKGKTQNLKTVYSNASIFILNSAYEGFPNSLMEAMAAGCASIANDCDYGPRELIKHEYNGLLARPGDETSLKDQLKRLMGSLELRIKLSREAPKICNKFSLDMFLANFERIILECT